MGPKEGKQGIWVRVNLDPVPGNHSMFDESSNQSRAIWVPKQRVEQILERGNQYNLTIGDRVTYLKKRLHGYVRYIGATHFSTGVYYGIELDEPRGKNNGRVKKKFYFECEDNYGIMLQFKKIGMCSLCPALARSHSSDTTHSHSLP